MSTAYCRRLESRTVNNCMHRGLVKLGSFHPFHTSHRPGKASRVLSKLWYIVRQPNPYFWLNLALVSIVDFFFVNFDSQDHPLDKTFYWTFVSIEQFVKLRNLIKPLLIISKITPTWMCQTHCIKKTYNPDYCCGLALTLQFLIISLVPTPYIVIIYIIFAASTGINIMETMHVWPIHSM